MNEENKIHINSFKFYDRNELEELTKEYYLKKQQLKEKMDKAFILLQLLHYKFDNNDAIHYEIEDIQKILKE